MRTLKRFSPQNFNFHFRFSLFPLFAHFLSRRTPPYGEFHYGSLLVNTLSVAVRHHPGWDEKSRYGNESRWWTVIFQSKQTRPRDKIERGGFPWFGTFCSLALFSFSSLIGDGEKNLNFMQTTSSESFSIQNYYDSRGHGSNIIIIVTYISWNHGNFVFFCALRFMTFS